MTEAHILLCAVQRSTTHHTLSHLTTTTDGLYAVLLACAVAWGGKQLLGLWSYGKPVHPSGRLAET